MNDKKKPKTEFLISNPSIGGTTPPPTHSTLSSPQPEKRPNPPRTVEDKEKSNEELLSKIEHLTKNIDHVNAIVIFGFIVLLIMVGQLLLEEWRIKTDSYNQLEDKIYQMEFERRIQEKESITKESNDKYLSKNTSPSKELDSIRKIKK